MEDDAKPSAAERAFLAFLQARERDPSIDVERFLDEHPSCADELRGVMETLAALAPDPRAEDAVDARLGRPLQDRYRIERFLGRGGMGRVYLATDLRTGAAVVVKVLDRGDDPEAHERFRREATVAGSLGHRQRGTARVFDLHALDDGTPYLVMEYVAGPSLRQRLAEGPIALAEAVPILERLCATLAAVHASGVAHGDLKPGNVILHRAHDGTRCEPVLIDFGVARVRGPLQVGPDTAAGEFRGTVRYASPESLDGKIDARSDQFSLGVLAYEIVTGRHPFDADGLGELVTRIRTFDPPRADAVVSAVPRKIALAIARAIAKRPEDRFASVADFGAALHDGWADAKRPSHRAIGPWAIALVVLVGSLAIPRPVAPPGPATPTVNDCPAPVPTPVIDHAPIPPPVTPAPAVVVRHNVKRHVPEPREAIEETIVEPPITTAEPDPPGGAHGPRGHGVAF
jgi:serine/threonine-protein kinase